MFDPGSPKMFWVLKLSVNDMLRRIPNIIKTHYVNTICQKGASAISKERFKILS